ncbi:LOW QUALITY PROTEIN: F-box protein At1g11270 [Elaeis guineensis]|uniref:LOW QUALITY PROTEIN: F-box protein At1g11270 n=1 Tax=Elaeis guineensis var. tenera TaxID=51953 RepID=UPI003C6D490D
MKNSECKLSEMSCGLERIRTLDPSAHCKRRVLEKCSKPKPSERDRAIHIPDDVMVNILSRLPVRSVLKFRCVCKLWHSLTQERYFVGQHYQHHWNKNNPGFIILSWIPRISEITLYYFTEEIHKFRMKGHRREETFSLSNPCDGLICVYGLESTYIVNPSIGEFVTLPEDSLNRPYRPNVGANIGLGYDISTGEYKVVRLAPRTRFPESCTTSCEIFTLGSHSWRAIGDVPYSVSCSVPAVNGNIHWTIRTDHDEDPRIGLSFDIKNETFDVILHPEGHTDSIFATVTELGGYLCVSSSNSTRANNHMQKDLYILEDYISRKWIKHTIDMRLVGLQNPSFLAPRMQPVVVQHGKIILANDWGRFEYYNPKTRCFEKPAFLTPGIVAPYLESLISPLAIQQTMDEGIPERDAAFFPSDRGQQAGVGHL